MSYTAFRYTRNHSSFYIAFAVFAVSICCLPACREKQPPEGKEIVESPKEMDEKVKNLISSYIDYGVSKNGIIDDSLLIYQVPVMADLYSKENFFPIWSSTRQWNPEAVSLIKFINQSRVYGLFPEDYHSVELNKIDSIFREDTLVKGERKDATLWARADLLLSDALVNVAHDVNLGRLPNDSITLRKDSVLHEDVIAKIFKQVKSGRVLDSVISELEPVHEGYKNLKTALKVFLSQADFKPVIQIPEINKNNMPEVKEAVIRRLFETGYLDSASQNPDSLELVSILKKYQKDKKLITDGKIGSQTIRSLNLSDQEKFARIAITMDRYKMLPAMMPEKYIWVNIPSFNLKLYSKDTVIVDSRVVVGKPQTRTPVLTSSLSELITYPQWNIPQSIIVKEILPGLKKDTAYLKKKGYSLLDKENEEIDPATVDWSKYSKGIPYKVIQGSGDENALGVLKFNFYNKYSVYMHDTNQRSFFSLDLRALSHGCVRVQDWEKMAFYIMRNENEEEYENTKRKPVSVDSLTRWLKIKEKHSIPLLNKIPVFIRYFTCEASNGKIIFYDDIYGEDQELRDRLFANKKTGS